jgi:hypothetical protein
MKNIKNYGVLIKNLIKKILPCKGDSQSIEENYCEEAENFLKNKLCNNSDSDYSQKKNLPWRLNNSYSFIFPIAYFITSITTIFILILLSCIKDGNVFSSTNRFPLHPLPAFYTMHKVQPLIYSISILLVAVIGLFNVWFYCSMLLQRFSVPELQSKKIGIHFMFILGILSNTMYVFFGFSNEILKLEKLKIRDVRISMSTIVYLTFIVFNIFFAVVAILSLESLIKGTNHNQNEENRQLYTSSCPQRSEKKNFKTRISQKIKMKKYVIYLATFVILLYITGIFIRNHEQINENHKKHSKTRFQFVLELILFILPYILFIINAFLNLTFYSDIIYIQDNLMTIIDREYFEADLPEGSIHLKIRE